MEETPATCTEEGTRQHWVYTDANGEISYTDRYLTAVMTDKDMIIPAMGHEWGEWETVREATADSEGLEKRVCKHDPNHVEERNTPNSQGSKTNAPSSGDRSNSTLWIVMGSAAAAAAVTVVTIAVRRRKKCDD